MTDLPFEKWAAIPGFMDYFVSSRGRIRYAQYRTVANLINIVVKKEADVKVRIDGNTPTIKACNDNGHECTINVAKLVALTFTDTTSYIEQKQMISVDFKDKNPANCAVPNLIISADLDPHHRVRRRVISDWLRQVALRRPADYWKLEIMLS